MFAVCGLRVANIGNVRICSRGLRGIRCVKKKDANNIADQLEISMASYAVFDEMTFR
jgi:hypothetical protein